MYSGQSTIDSMLPQRVMKIGGQAIDIDTGDIVKPASPVLREYQERAVSQTREAIINGHRKILLVLPTGAGKSFIIAKIISLAVEKGNRVLWLVHRRNLVTQMQETLEKFGVDAGVIMAGVESDTIKRVQIGTYQTYQRRIKLEGGHFFIDADMVIVDEAHRSISKGYLEILEHYSGKVIIGCTATPMRSDGRPMGKVYDKIVDVIGVQELTDNGFLAPARYFCAPVNLDEVRVVRGDYDTKELDKKTNTRKLVGDIVQNWLKNAQNRPTIVFCVTVRHSIHICKEFQKNGVSAIHLDARSTDEERDDAFRQMVNGDATVLCNVALYQEGMDCPNISCVVMARPTKSLGLYRQSCGRGLRISREYPDCIIMDHGGVVEEHGLLTDEITWTLNGKDKAYKKKKEKEKEEKTVKCPSCNQVFQGLKACPECGTELKTFGVKVETVDADLVELKGRKKATTAEKRQYLGMLRFWVKQKGYNPKMVTAKYKTRYGCWIHHSLDNTAPIEPDKNFLNLMRHDQIKYAKSKQKGGNCAN